MTYLGACWGEDVWLCVRTVKWWRSYGNSLNIQASVVRWGPALATPLSPAVHPNTGWQQPHQKSKADYITCLSPSSDRESVQQCYHSNTLYYLRDRSKLAVRGSHSSSVSIHGQVWWTVWRRKQQLNHICGDGLKQNIDHADHFHPTSSPQKTERNQVPKQVPWMDTRGEWFPVKKDVSTSKPQMWPGTPSWMMHQSWPSRNSEMEPGVEEHCSP